MFRPSGDYSLHVNPSDILGRGNAEYRFSKGDDVLWEKEFPYTLWEALITDDGQIAGYAYTYGWEGFSEKGYKAGVGDMLVVLLDRNGKELSKNKYPRHHSRFPGEGPDPLVKEIYVHEKTNRMILRIADPDINRRVDKGWVYDLADGKRREVLDRIPVLEKSELQFPIVVYRELSNLGTQKFPDLSLRKIGETDLKFNRPGPDDGNRGISAFDFDLNGNLCAFRNPKNGSPALIYLNQKGKTLQELAFLPALENLSEKNISGPASVGVKKFVVAVSERGVGGKSQFFVADFDAGTLKPLKNVECPGVESVAGFPDGRFAVVTSRQRQYSSIDGLFFFGPDGTLLWRKEQMGNSGGKEELLSPEDISCDGKKNEIAVLDVVRQTIQIFDVTGKLFRFLDLEKTWGRKPNYPTDVFHDNNGGFLVTDFDAQKAIVWMDAKGTITRELNPTLSDGRPVDMFDGGKCSPQGDLWVCDGDSVMRLNADTGVVNRTLGSGSNPSVLTDPEIITVGPDDRIFVADEKTKSVHVADSSGNVVGHCKPKGTDFKGHSWLRQIAVSPRGDVFCHLDRRDYPAFLHFDSKWNRLGPKKVKVDPIAQDWYFQPNSELCWVVGYNDVYLVRNLDKTIRRISRRADGNWLEYTGEAAVAPDGSLALLARNENDETTVNIISPDGTVARTFPVSVAPRYAAEICFSGRHVYVRNNRDLFIFDTEGTAVGRFNLPDSAMGENWAGPFSATKGKEIWFVSRKELEVYRYSVDVEN